MIPTVIRPEPPAFAYQGLVICGLCAWVIAYNWGIQLEPAAFAADVRTWSCGRCKDTYRRRQRAQP